MLRRLDNFKDSAPVKELGLSEDELKDAIARWSKISGRVLKSKDELSYDECEELMMVFERMVRDRGSGNSIQQSKPAPQVQPSSHPTPDVIREVLRHATIASQAVAANKTHIDNNLVAIANTIRSLEGRIATQELLLREMGDRAHGLKAQIEEKDSRIQSLESEVAKLRIAAKSKEPMRTVDASQTKPVTPAIAAEFAGIDPKIFGVAR